uniref:Uncharacterized protein n=1 Tax=Sinocyclocheilus rhinocerous TaxID=307959 RepID=A0A673GAH8_9TELE
MECCALSDRVHEAMLESLSLNLLKPDEVNMFGKGLLVAACQILPWCTSREWERLLKVLQELLLRLSVFLLRIFQLLCSSSCSDWLSPQGWVHTGRLYANAMRGIIILFVFTQLFCLVLHVQVMIPGQPEALFLCALEILTHYEAVISAYPDSCTALQGLNTRHFFSTITDNLHCADMKAALHQKIAQL